MFLLHQHCNYQGRTNLAWFFHLHQGFCHAPKWKISSRLHGGPPRLPCICHIPSMATAYDHEFWWSLQLLPWWRLVLVSLQIQWTSIHSPPVCLMCFIVIKNAYQQIFMTVLKLIDFLLDLFQFVSSLECYTDSTFPSIQCCTLQGHTDCKFLSTTLLICPGLVMKCSHV